MDIFRFCPCKSIMAIAIPQAIPAAPKTDHRMFCAPARISRCSISRIPLVVVNAEINSMTKPTVMLSEWEPE